MPPTIQELEAALINADNAGDVEAATAIAADMDMLMKAQQQPQQPTGPDYKTMSGMEVAERAVKNIPSDIYNLGAQTVEAVTSPVETTTGLIDLASAGMSKVLDVTGLSKYADPQKMEKYRQVRGMIGKELGDVFTKEGLKQRIAEKPITSLLDISLLGQGVTAPVKATKYGGMANKFSKMLDPTQIVTKPAGAAFEKISDVAATKASQYGPALEKVKSHINKGFVIPPSEVESAGLVKRTTQSLLGEKTPFKASVKNQQVINSKIRQHLNVPENTPLENVLDVVETRSKPIYNEIRKIKPQLVQRGKTVKQTTTGPMGETIELPSKRISTKKTRSGEQILKDLQEQRRKTKKEYRLETQRANKEGVTADFTKAENSLSKQRQLETELQQLVDLYGDSNISNQLKNSRADFAKAFSIQDSIVKGNLDAIQFAKKNKNKYITGEAKDIIDFADEYPNLVKKQKEPTIIPRNLTDIKTSDIVTAGATALGGLPLGAAALGARQVIPSLLLSKFGQRGLANTNFIPVGSSVLRGLANQPAVTGATYIPSLLESSDIELARYL